MEENNEKSIYENLEYLNETKGIIKQAIIDKGVTVDNNTPFREYADKISEISGGGDTKPYIELEYIESTGTQYIDTGYKVNMNTDTIEVEVNVTRENGSHFVFGNYSTNNYYGFNFYGETSSLYFYYNLAQVNINTSHSGVGEITKLKATNTNFYVNNTSVGTFETVNNTTLYNAFIFGASTINSVEFPSKMKLYSCKITSANNVVRDFIPVKRKSDNEICLYDKVTETFFTNQGTGTFIAGSAKVETTMNIFVQTTEPEVKKGIWLQTDKTVEHFVSDDVYTGGEWAPVSATDNLPNRFYNGAAVNVGTDIYILGGGNSSSTRVYNYKYNTLNNTYTKMSDIPYSFWSCTAVSIGTDIYLIGSYDAKTNNYKYDTLTDTYTKMSDIPYQFNSGSAIAIGTDIYLFGGGTAELSKNVYKYNTLTDTYTQLSSAPMTLGESQVVAIGTDIYILGSYDNDHNNQYACKYNTLTDTYTRLTDVPYKFYAGSAVLIGTDIYLFGGYNNPTKFSKYNTLTDTYTLLEDMPYSYYQGSAVKVGSFVYVLGSEANTDVSYYNRKYIAAGKTYSTDNTVVIAEGTTYSTELFNTNFEEGYKPKYNFSDAFFYTTQDGLMTDIPTYYGDGTQWINIKNPPQVQNNE